MLFIKHQKHLVKWVGVHFPYTRVPPLVHTRIKCFL
jgi:hypothetical protein